MRFHTITHLLYGLLSANQSTFSNFLGHIIIIFLQGKKCRSVLAGGLGQDCKRGQLDRDGTRKVYGLEKPPQIEVQTGKEGY